MGYHKCKICGKRDLILDENIRSGRCIDCTYKRQMKWLLGISIPLVSFLIIFSILFYVKWDYPMQRDVWGVLDRAQITAESEDMLKLVQEARTNLENKENLFGKNQIEGHCALIFKEPSNDLGAQYLAIKNIEKRLERTDTFDKSSVEYQTAIDDIRGTIRELPYLDCWIWRFN